MVPVADLIKLFQQMYNEHWKYEWGKSEKGCVDCSGAFVYAFRQFGISFPHGSNAIARKYTVGGLLPVSQAKPGMAAFKAHPPGESGYDLPEKYRASGDLNDYYHIGLLDDDPAYVLNAKGTKSGFCRDKISSGWDSVAYLKDVDYKEGDESMTEMTVVLPAGAKGNTVNLRAAENKDARVIARVPAGSRVKLLVDNGTWCCVQYDGLTGYMMSNYLEYDGRGDETISPDQYDQVQEALRVIEEQVELIGSIIGRG